ncbi:hypothetical protein K1X76_06690 [bacterium]|nr:hypothetical protein [bacterium]
MSGYDFTLPEGADLAKAVVEAFSDNAGLTKDELIDLGLRDKRADILIDVFHNGEKPGVITNEEKGDLDKIFGREFVGGLASMVNVQDSATSSYGSNSYSGSQYDFSQMRKVGIEQCQKSWAGVYSRFGGCAGNFHAVSDEKYQFDVYYY